MPKYFKDAGQYDKYWIIDDGLEVGDKYIITNITNLIPNTKVNPKDTIRENDATVKDDETNNAPVEENN